MSWMHPEAVHTAIHFDLSWTMVRKIGDTFMKRTTKEQYLFLVEQGLNNWREQQKLDRVPNKAEVADIVVSAYQHAAHLESGGYYSVWWQAEDRQAQLSSLLGGRNTISDLPSGRRYDLRPLAKR
jgi:hypothetical protein